ncbi:MAG: hypothetical protein FJ276_26120, partial [Planctomycetes bacterium]|nr:hypothetical protein [Planctomycetota bacterium]
MRSLEPAKNILLTGAGFTKTFGGFLAGEMWAAILNELRGVPYPSLRELMFDDKDLDYERVYDDVLRNRQLTPAEKDAFGRSMHGAYSRMNDLFTDPMRTAEFAAVFQAFVSWFCGVEERDLGFYFTLNQDLFVETFYTPRAGGSRLRLPGLSSPKWFKREPLSLLEEGIALPPSADEAASELWRKNPSRLVYIKLHGSLGWRSSDGSSVMVIGHSKSAQIQEEPLL